MSDETRARRWMLEIFGEEAMNFADDRKLMFIAKRRCKLLGVASSNAHVESVQIGNLNVYPTLWADQAEALARDGMALVPMGYQCTVTVKPWRGAAHTIATACLRLRGADYRLMVSFIFECEDEPCEDAVEVES